jgi:outer membrane protein, adhesin transport system
MSYMRISLSPDLGCFNQALVAWMLMFGAGLTLADNGIVKSNSSPDAGLQRTLSQLLARAVAGHPSVRAKTAELNGSRAILEAAQWQTYPSLSVQTERATGQNSSVQARNISTNLRIQQTLWSGGRVDAAVQNAEWKQRAAQYALQEARTTLALRTLDAWQSLLSFHGRQQANTRLLAQLEMLNEMMKRRITQQVSPAIDGQLLNARLAQARSDQLNALAGIEAASQRLVQWVGPEAVALIAANANSADLTEYLPPWPVETSQRLEQAINSSPSLRRYDADSAAVKEEIRQREAEQWPTVYTRVERQFNSNPQLLGKTAENSVYLGLQYNSGAGLSLRAQVAAAVARSQSLEEERDSVLRQVRESYTSEWRDYQATVARIAFARVVVDVQAALFESNTRQFVAGRRSWLELLNALREQNAADQNLTDLQAQQQASYGRIRLYLLAFEWQSDPAP